MSDYLSLDNTAVWLPEQLGRTPSRGIPARPGAAVPAGNGTVGAGAEGPIAPGLHGAPSGPGVAGAGGAVPGVAGTAGRSGVAGRPGVAAAAPAVAAGPGFGGGAGLGVAAEPKGPTVSGVAGSAGPVGSDPAGEASPDVAADSGGAKSRRAAPRHRVRGRRQKPGRPALSQPTGPHVRLGILWAGVTLGALLLGTGWLAGWMAVVAAMAAGSAARSWGTAAMAQRLGNNRRARVQPPAAVAALFSALIALAALAGALVVAVAAAAIVVCLVAAATFGPLGQPGVLRRVVIVLGPGLAASCLVLARAQGLAEGLVLAGMVTVFDSSNYLIGTGAPNHWEGSVAGAASIAALTLFVAAVLEPPFTGASPWLLGGAAALLAPIGPVLARWVIGDRAAPVPALRRLDSLFVVGPAWVAGVGLLLKK